jgi:DNA-binding NarL/FixJ family response regulator
MFGQLDRDQTPINVIVADSSRIHTQLLSDALGRDPGFQVIAAHGADDLEAKVSDGAQRVAVVSSYLDEEASRGCVLIRKLSFTWPKIRFVLLLDSIKRESVLEAFAAGARGIFHRQEPLETLSHCIRQVHNGQIWANSEQMSYAVEALASAPQVRAVNAQGVELLSKREREVVTNLAAGLSNREIGERLGLSQHTIKNYLLRIFDKLGVSTRVELLSLTLTQHAQRLPVQSFVADLLDEEGDETNVDINAYRQAAEHGLTRAQLKMAEACLRGSEDKDAISAYMWYLLAEKSNLNTRDKIIADKRKLAERLTTDQILEAQKLASEKRLDSIGAASSINAQAGHSSDGPHAK